jgi:uncharacterized protein YndB with AHSA1/START domain
MPETATAHQLTIVRVFDAPRELVWKAWTEPEQLARWWGRRGWTAVPATIRMDVRPGGVFRLTAVNHADGRQMPTEAVYREVAPPERLVFAEAPRPGCHQGAVGTVTLHDIGGGRTEMVFQTTLQLPEELGATRHGLASAFDRLAEHLARHDG